MVREAWHQLHYGKKRISQTYLFYLFFYYQGEDGGGQEGTLGVINLRI